ncbi:MAG: tectonin domain-containing protein [Chloroflexota bacterium]
MKCSPDGVYNNLSVMHTQSENQPWWQVDLKNTYELESVKLFGRTDCCKDRLSDFYILISNNDMRGKTLSQLLSDPTVWKLYEPGVVDGNKEFSTPAVGRFVRIQRRGAGYLQIAETQVFGKNKAIGKTATQSSQYNGATTAAKAIDGNIDGVFNNGSVASTNGGNEEWWQLDMGESHHLGRIWLFNRSDCCRERFAHFYVFASDTDMSGRTLDQLKNDPDVWQYFEVAAVGSRYLVAAGDAKGRYLRIQRNTTGFLTIAEVVINGIPSSQASTEQLNPAEFGQWSDPISWPHISVHASMLPSGKLLTWDATPDDFTPVHDPHTSPNNTTRATLWDPETGIHTDGQNANGTDLFCAGHNHLADGRMFVAGGTQGYNQSIHNTQTFNSLTEKWVLGPTLSQARWYPGVADLASGNMLITAGRGNTPELYTPVTNSLRQYSGISIGGSWPIIRQAPDGSIVYAGGDSTGNIYTLDLTGNGSLNASRTDSPLVRTSVHAMYDIGKVLYAGGGVGTDTALNRQSARILDLDSSQIASTNTMNYRRFRHNLTILADGSVMAVGGLLSGTGFCNAESSTHAGEIWNPETGQWSIMASQDRPRHYHSTSVLLPDGRVWSGGSGYATNVSTQQARCPYQNTSEIFSPPYLYNPDGTLATRPEITFAPKSALYNKTFELLTTNANDIQKVGLVKLSSVTHKLNTGQRYVPLSYQVVNSQKLAVTTPADANIATAGYYMLFIINQQGTPSISEMFQLGQSDIQWTQIPGGLKHVSYGTDGSLWGTDASNQVYRRQPSDENWQQVTLPVSGLKQVDALDYDRAVGVTANDQIYIYDGNSWTRISGGLKHASYAVDGSIWGTNVNNQVYRRAASATSWQRMTLPVAGLKQVDALDYDRAVGVTTADRIYLYDGNSWTQLPGGLKHVSYGIDGSLWGTNVNNQVYRRTATATTWQRMTLPVSGLTQVDALDYNRAAGVTVDDIVYHFDDIPDEPAPNNLTAQIEPTLPTSTASDITFEGVGTGSEHLTYQWDFGDGTTTGFSAEATVSHQYQNPGRYNVILTVRDVSGVEAAATHLQAVHAPTTTQQPAVSMSIAYEAVGIGRIWNVNPDNDSVTVINASNNQKVAEIAVGTEPRSLAIAPNGDIWVANRGSSTISVIDPSSLNVVQTIQLIRGAAPYGLAFAPNGSAAFVALEGSGKLLKLNPATGAEVGNVDVGQHARHVSISYDSQTVYVARFVTPPVAGESTAAPSLNGHGGEVVAVNASSLQIEQTILLEESQELDTPFGARGLPNYLGALALSPDGQSGWVPSKQDNILRGQLRDGNNLNHDRTIRSITSLINLQTGSEERTARIDHDNGGIASAAAYGLYGSYLFVALEGSREVAIVDAYGKSEIGRIEVGRAPQGLLVSPDGSKLYIHNFMDRSVEVRDLNKLMTQGIVDVTTLATISTVATESLTATVLQGKQFFYDAFDGRLAAERYISCASCHNGGESDGRVWDFTGFGEGLRNTISLEGHGGPEHGRLHWSANFDEVHDFEGQVRGLAGGTGLMSNADFNATQNPLGAPKAGRNAELDALAAYVNSLTAVGSSPYRNSDGTLTSDGLAGRLIFAQQNCASCHSGIGWSMKRPPPTVAG